MALAAWAQPSDLHQSFQIVAAPSKGFAVYRGIGGQPLNQAWAVTSNEEILGLIQKKLADAVSARADGHQAVIRIELLQADHNLKNAWSPTLSVSLALRVSIDDTGFSKIFYAEASRKAWHLTKGWEARDFEARRQEAADMLVKRILDEPAFVKTLLG